MPSEFFRTFVCLELPTTIQVQAEALQHKLADLGSSIRWVDPPNLHLTLRFLGEISGTQLRAVCCAVCNAASQVDTFSLELSGTGCFPSARRPRAFWIGVTKNASLTLLCGALEEQLFSAGFDREVRPFSPHLTLGRVRVDRMSVRVREVLAKAEFEAASFLVTNVTVMKSQLGKSGAVHTPVAREPLQSCQS